MMVRVVVDIPDSAKRFLPPTEQLPHDLLEAYAVERYRSGTLTQKQVGLLLGLDRWSTEDLLRRHEVLKTPSLEDLESVTGARRRGDIRPERAHRHTHLPSPSSPGAHVPETGH